MNNFMHPVLGMLILLMSGYGLYLFIRIAIMGAV